MVKKTYSVSFDEDLVIKAQELYKKKHPLSKLSPLINSLLEKWYEENKEDKSWRHQ